MLNLMIGQMLQITSDKNKENKNTVAHIKQLSNAEDLSHLSAIEFIHFNNLFD